GGRNAKVWGCITPKGVGHLYCANRILTGLHDTQILEEVLLGILQDHGLSTHNTFFQHDNDPKHTSHSATCWLADHTLNVLPWPASSFDSNIIKHVWNHLDRKVQAWVYLPHNHEDLWAAL
ncbi:hypothetical protein BDV93DRAFT_397404, partial [Ceratobasidium sp. AG-I]